MAESLGKKKYQQGDDVKQVNGPRQMRREMEAMDPMSRVTDSEAMKASPAGEL